MKIYIIPLLMLLLINPSFSQILYTDVVPDITVSTTGSYDLDLDNDGNADYILAYNGITGNVTIEVSGSNEVVGLFGGVDFFPDALVLNAPIDAFMIQWSNFSGNPMLMTGGNWNGVWDGYLGLKFKIGINWHYAWARLNVGQQGDLFTIKDYAYEDVADLQILAGELPPSAARAHGIVGSDIADNNNGLDLEIFFNKPLDESSVIEYRVMVVKAADAPAFTVADAEGVAFPKYVSIIPSNSNITDTLSATAMDVDGDPVQNVVPYNIFVLSIADGTNAILNALSDSSNAFTLLTTADMALGINIADIGDNGNGDDLEVTFNRASNEATVGEYRLIAVPFAEAGSFDLGEAEAVPSINYISVDPLSQPTVDPLVETFGANGRDKNGSDIVNGVAYSVFVLNIADGSIATTNALSPPSNTLTLEEELNGIEDETDFFNIYFSDGKLIVDVKGDQMHAADKYQVSDVMGRIVLQGPLESGVHHLELPRSGIYFVSLYLTSKILTREIFVD